MAWHLSPGAGLGGWKRGEIHECQVDSLSRHHIRQRMGQTGGAQGLLRGTVPDGGEIRDGLTQEVAWEVRLRKRKA